MQTFVLDICFYHYAEIPYYIDSMVLLLNLLLFKKSGHQSPLSGKYGILSLIKNLISTFLYEQMQFGNLMTKVSTKGAYIISTIRFGLSVDVINLIEFFQNATLFKSYPPGINIATIFLIDI